MKNILNTWYQPMDEAGCILELEHLLPKLEVLYENTIVYPYKINVFRMFHVLPYDSVKAILLGQDPYHSIHNGQPDACGYSFLTENGYIPPSLKNMYKELQSDNVLKTKGNGKHPYTAENYPYKNWIRQGVFMLNTALTVEAGKPGSHLKLWSNFSTKLIKYLVAARPDIVWILLGSKAYNTMLPYVDGIQNLEDPDSPIKAVVEFHPSPLAGNKFLGSKIYSRTNKLLDEPIIW